MKFIKKIWDEINNFIDLICDNIGKMFNYMDNTIFIYLTIPEPLLNFINNYFLPTVNFVILFVNTIVDFGIDHFLFLSYFHDTILLYKDSFYFLYYYILIFINILFIFLL